MQKVHVRTRGQGQEARKLYVLRQLWHPQFNMLAGTNHPALLSPLFLLKLNILQSFSGKAQYHEAMATHELPHRF